MDAASVIAVPTLCRVAAVKPELDFGRVRDIVLVRIATGGKALLRAELASELWPLVSHLLTRAEWATALDRDFGALADAGLCEAKPVTISSTEAGRKRAALVLGMNALPRTWTEAKAGRLIAKALGLEQQPPRRVKALMKAEGLRSAVVQQAFKLKMRGVPTPARLRVELAKLALSRAFADALPTGLDRRSGLSAKAGRNLAGRLAHPPRDFPTDSRLVAALATEHVGAAKGDHESLQNALLRRYVTRGAVTSVTPSLKPARARRTPSTILPAAASRVTPTALHLVTVPAPVTVATAVKSTVRPDFSSFVASVRAAATTVAEGWLGNRKAFVSKVWLAVHARHPEWQVSEIEFKAMLAEAHRVGQVVLANADLKDQRSIAEIQASAIAYKNTIFHYVRVDD